MIDKNQKDDQKRLSVTIGGIVIAVFLVFVVFWSIDDLHPPKPVSAVAPADAFSSGRAMEHLRVIATKPHPIGSPENHRVRDYLLQELKKLGVEPQVQKTQVTRYRSNRVVRAAMVENILVRLKGTANSKAVLLMSHYDTVPNACGATDDGSGVVTMLETLRALKAKPPLKNDVIFLFTDGEEIGLMGAKAFVDEHIWVEDVGVVLNFEGSGSSGSSLMFEASDRNGWLIKEFARAAPYPVANSLSYEIYKRLPNDTDLTPFKNAGYSGLNFAYIDDRYDYHTANDNLDNIDEGSVQHHGSYGFALTRHFGNMNLEETKGGNSVYFNSIGFGFVHYPEKWVIPFMVLTILGYVVLIVLGFRGKQLNILGILFSFFAFLVHLVIALLIVTCIFQIIKKPYTGTEWWLLFYHHKWLLLGFTCFTVAISVTFYRLLMKGIRIWHMSILIAGINILLKFGRLFQWKFLLISIVVSVILYFMFRRGRNVWNLSMGSLFGWIALMAVGSIIVPGGSYLVTWPLFFSMIPLGLLFVTNARNHLSIMIMGLFAVFAIPVIHWYSSVTYAFFLAMGLDLLWVAMVFVVLAMGLLIPHVYYISRVDRWIIPGLAICVGVICILMGTKGARFDERCRKPSCLFYGVNSDNDKAIWASTDRELDEWASAYFSDKSDTISLAEFIPGSSAKILKGDAPISDLKPPEISILEDNKTDDIRTIKMRLVSKREAPHLYMFFHPKANIVGANVNGSDIEGFDDSEERTSEKWWQWAYFAVPEEGIVLTLRTESAASVEMKLTDVSYGFPELPDFSFKPRPLYMMPAPYAFSDMTLVTKSYTF